MSTNLKYGNIAEGSHAVIGDHHTIMLRSLVHVHSGVFDCHMMMIYEKTGSLAQIPHSFRDAQGFFFQHSSLDTTRLHLKSHWLRPNYVSVGFEPKL